MKTFRVFTEGQIGELQISANVDHSNPTDMYDDLEDELHTADHANTPDQELAALKQVAALALFRIDQIMNGCGGAS